MVTYIEEGHKYVVKGKEIPSVSELVRFACGDIYKDVPKRILENKANYGTQVHRLIQAYIEGDLTKGDLKSMRADPSMKIAVSQYAALEKKYLMHIKECEKMVDYKERYAGRLDLLDRTGEIFDIKTTVEIHEEQLAWQLGLYYMALGTPKDFGYVVHLPKGAPGKVELIEVRDFNDCLDLLERYEKERYSNL